MSKQAPQYLHELNSFGQHRIVRLEPSGLNEVSEWHPVERIIALGAVFACADPSSPLPPHLFTVRAVPAQVLA
jgi:hypothetical protein